MRGGITNGVLKFKKNQQISQLINFHELPMNCVLVYHECPVRVLLQPIYTGKNLKKSSFCSLYIYSHQTQAHLCKYKTMYKVQVCYSNFLENKLFIFLNYEFIFLRLKKRTNKQKKKQQHNRNQKYPVIICNCNLKYPAISSFTVFMLNVCYM